MRAKWIRTRLPTVDDANDHGLVLCKPDYAAPYEAIIEDEYWYPLPKIDANEPETEEDEIFQWASDLAKRVDEISKQIQESKMSFDSKNNKGGVQGHSQGEYFPATIKTIGDHSGSEPVFTHVVLYGGLESSRFDSFAEAEDFARTIRRLLDDGDDDAAKLLVNLNRELA